VPVEHLHKPSTAPDGLPQGYPEPIVVHAVERKDALDRYAAVRDL
jgi:deoxyribodipyrimidine photo-lyase